MWLNGAVRDIKKNLINQEMSQLVSSGLPSDQIVIRYRELTAIQNQLMAEEIADKVPR